MLTLLKIWILLLLFDSIKNVFFKTDLNYFYCGIFAWAGKTPKKFNKDKFDKLGLYNMDRGKTGCGVFADGEIFAGAKYDDKLYSDFIKKYDFKIEKYPVVIGHTRNASPGMAITYDNTHPFGFGKLDDGYEFVGCHNGTLYNHEELAERYNVPLKVTKVFKNTFGVKSKETRTKIDSEVLLECIYTNKNFKVLSKYEGAAALVFTNLNEPNKIYVWKGASKEYKYSNKIEEERPLFYYQETKNSVYISSIEDSLITIGGESGVNVFSFESNVVYIIEDGNVKTAEKIIISRKENLQKKSNIYTNPNLNRGTNYYDDYSDVDYGPPIKNNSGNIIKTGHNIYQEPLIRDMNDYKGRVYFNKLRYFRNGHKISGVYIWVSGWGYSYLGNDLLTANAQLKNLINIPFIDGDFDYSQTVKNPYNSPYMVPVTTNNFTKDFNNIHFFIHGVKVKDKLDFNALYLKVKENENIDYEQLSYVAAHPICDSKFVFKSVNKQDVLLEGKPVDGTYHPLGSERTYTFSKGNLLNYKESKAGVNLLFNYKKTDYKNTAMTVVKNELKQEDKEILKLVDSELATPIFDIGRIIDKLKKYKNNEKAITISENLEACIDYLEEAYEEIKI